MTDDGPENRSGGLMLPRLGASELEALARFSTPTLSNAIETFGVRPANAGFAGPEIRCLFPDLGTMVGYAATVRIAADRPAPPGASDDTFLRSYWRSIVDTPAPTIVVVEDLDPEPVGALIGEVNANVYQAMGCVGAVLRGGVRDIEEMRAAGFHTFASAVLVSRAYVHVVEFGQPVRIGRLQVGPGDLIHADRHGVLTIPVEIARELPRVAEEIERLEREIIDVAGEPAFSIDRLAGVWQSVVARSPQPGGATDDRPEHV
jgi:regulator of RNase E activity RraA